MRAIADSGDVVAFLNRSDRHHHLASEIGRSVSEPLLTCEPVLAEAAYLTESTHKVMALLQRGFLRIAFDLPRHI